jgi:hypothetical protein
MKERVSVLAHLSPRLPQASSGSDRLPVDDAL